ncbi:MAG: DNA polymerase III subunit beta [Planctomycetota bacterium]
MKITCSREPLTNAFSLAASIAPARSPKEILNNVKLTASGGKAMLTATDMEVGIRVELEEGIEIEAEGTALLPVVRTLSILRESTDETIHLETDDSGILLSGARSKFTLPGSNPDEFPPVASFDESKYHTLPTRCFRSMVKRTVFATDTENSRFALGGVLLELTTDEVTAVGTDGRRLACMRGEGESVGGHETSGMSTIVPTRAIQLMERAVDDSFEFVDIAARSSDLLLRTSGIVIYSRLVEGRYPNWRQVIPKREDATVLDFTVGPLFAALRQAAIVTDNESRGIDFTFGNGTLRLEASTKDVGQSQIEVPVPYDGEPVTLTMDHRYVADFCKVLDREQAFQFEFESPASPALLSTEDGFTYVIMPMSRDR